MTSRAMSWPSFSWSSAVVRLAMAHPGLAFGLADDRRSVLRLAAPEPGLDPEAARLARLAALLGPDFADNAVAVAGAREGLHVESELLRPGPLDPWRGKCQDAAEENDRRCHRTEGRTRAANPHEPGGGDAADD